CDLDVGPGNHGARGVLDGAGNGLRVQHSRSGQAEHQCRHLQPEGEATRARVSQPQVASEGRTSEHISPLECWADQTPIQPKTATARHRISRTPELFVHRAGCKTHSYVRSDRL